MSIYDSLNKEQKEAVLHDKGPLLILAGAGSGKTRVITHRIVYLMEECGVSPFQIMAITFTNKAAKEMRERVDSLVSYGADNIWISTFHSSCVRFLRRFSAEIGYDTNFSIYDTDDQKAVIKDIIKQRNLDPKKYKERAFLSYISSAKNNLISPDEYVSAQGNSDMNRLTALVYADYQKAMKASNAFDFDDLLVKSVELFQTCPEALAYYRRRFRYIMVDEYQDTNRVQFELIRLLAAYTNEDGEVENNLCVVGDDDQSIYRFRGADIRNILDFESVYPQAKVIKLEQNYRSSGNILAAANAVIANNRGRKPKALWTTADMGASLSFCQYETDREEARSVAGTIEERTGREHLPYRHFAVLYRTNAQSRALEEACIYRGIPYRLVGGVNFYQRKEIKDVLAYLKTIDNGMDQMAVKRILNVPKRGIGQTTIDRIDGHALTHAENFYEALKEAATIPDIKKATLTKLSGFVSLIESFREQALQPDCSLKKLIDDILKKTGYLEELKLSDPESADERIENINELINKAVTFEQEAGEHTLSAFLSEVALVADIDSVEEDADYVLLMTLHSSKGLEFEHVFLCGMEEGLFPSAMSINAENPELEIEEERRLCYVGITRAKQTLTLSAARCRMLRGEFQYSNASRFVGEIPRHLLSKRTTTAGPESRYLNKETGARSGSLDAFLSKHSTAGSSGASSYRSQSSGLSSGYTRPVPKPATSYASTTSGAAGHTASKPASVYARTPSPAASPSTALGFAVGDTVKHLRFGVGTVKNISQGSRDYEVTVEFPSGVKKMLASFAKLEKI